VVQGSALWRFNQHFLNFRSRSLVGLTLDRALCSLCLFDRWTTYGFCLDVRALEAGFTNGHDLGYRKVMISSRDAPKSSGLVQLRFM